VALDNIRLWSERYSHEKEALVVCDRRGAVDLLTDRVRKRRRTVSIRVYD
jgi:hypothetical protein